MKKLYKLLSIFLALAILLLNSNISPVYSKDEEKSMTILFTHHLHDHYYPFDVNESDKIVSRGGSYSCFISFWYLFWYLG